MGTSNFDQQNRQQGLTLQMADFGDKLSSLFCLFNYFMFGAFDATLGVAIPAIAHALNKNLDYFGLAYTARGIGFLAGTIISASLHECQIISSLQSKKGCLSVSTMLVGISHGLLTLATAPPSVIMLAFLEGVGTGGIDCFSSCILLNIWGDKVKPWTNLLFVLFGVGGFVGPMTVSIFGWKTIFQLLAALSTFSILDPIISWTIFCFKRRVQKDNTLADGYEEYMAENRYETNIPTDHVSADIVGGDPCIEFEVQSDTLPVSTASREVILVQTVFCFLCLGLEVGFGAWITSFVFESHIVASENKAALVSASYYAALSAGRLCTALIVGRTSSSRLITVHLALSLLASVAFAFLAGDGFVHACVASACLGFGLSAMLPLVQTILHDFDLFIDDTTITVYIFGQSCGDIVIPLCLGQTLVKKGPFAFAACIVLVVLLMIAVFLMFHVLLVYMPTNKNKRAVAVVDGEKPAAPAPHSSLFPAIPAGMRGMHTQWLPVHEQGGDGGKKAQQQLHNHSHSNSIGVTSILGSLFHTVAHSSHALLSSIGSIITHSVSVVIPPGGHAGHVGQQQSGDSDAASEGSSSAAGGSFRSASARRTSFMFGGPFSNLSTHDSFNSYFGEEGGSEVGLGLDLGSVGVDPLGLATSSGRMVTDVHAVAEIGLQHIESASSKTFVAFFSLLDPTVSSVSASASASAHAPSASAGIRTGSHTVSGAGGGGGGGDAGGDTRAVTGAGTKAADSRPTTGSGSDLALPLAAKPISESSSGFWWSSLSSSAPASASVSSLRSTSVSELSERSERPRQSSSAASEAATGCDDRLEKRLAARGPLVIATQGLGPGDGPADGQADGPMGGPFNMPWPSPSRLSLRTFATPRRLKSFEANMENPRAAGPMVSPQQPTTPAAGNRPTLVPGWLTPTRSPGPLATVAIKGLAPGSLTPTCGPCPLATVSSSESPTSSVASSMLASSSWLLPSSPMTPSPSLQPPSSPQVATATAAAAAARTAAAAVTVAPLTSTLISTASTSTSAPKASPSPSRSLKGTATNSPARSAQVSLQHTPNSTPCPSPGPSPLGPNPNRTTCTSTAASPGPSPNRTTGPVPGPSPLSPSPSRSSRGTPIGTPTGTPLGTPKGSPARPTSSLKEVGGGNGSEGAPFMGLGLSLVPAFPFIDFGVGPQTTAPSFTPAATPGKGTDKGAGAGARKDSIKK